MPDPDIDDPILGPLHRNEDYGYYEGTFGTGDEAISVSLYPGDDGDLTQTLDWARRICADFPRVRKAAEDYLVARLLDVKNADWPDDDGPLTEEQFRSRIDPVGVELSTGPGGYATFYFGCDEMFTDHGLSASMDQDGNWFSAGLDG